LIPFALTFGDANVPHFNRGKISYHTQFGVKLFHHHLVGYRVCPCELVPNLSLVIAFCELVWNPSRREGPTLRHYARGATDLLRALGEDISKRNVQAGAVSGQPCAIRP